MLDLTGLTGALAALAISRGVVGSPTTPSVSVQLGTLGTSYRGRSFQAKRFSIETELAPGWLVAFHHDQVLAKGRSGGSRFSTWAGEVSIGHVTGQWNLEAGYGWLAEGVAERPDTRAAYVGPRLAWIAASYGPYRASLGRIAAPRLAADWATLSYRRTLLAQHQWTITGSLEGSLEIARSGGNSTRLTLQTEITRRIDKRTDASLSITALPFGAPLYSRAFPAVSAFAIYEPGGIVSEIRRNALFAFEFTLRIKF